MLPNLAGSKPDWKALRARVPKGIWLFEDSADIMTYTEETDISTISFYASHIITAGGLGGCINYNDDKLLYHDRKGVLRFLENADVQIRVFFAGNITRHPAYRHYLKAYPGADTVMKDAFLIGAHHGLTYEDIDRVCDLLIEYDRKHAQSKATVAA